MNKNDKDKDKDNDKNKTVSLKKTLFSLYMTVSEEFLIKRIKSSDYILDKKNSNGDTLLLIAIRDLKLNVAETLISCNASVNLQNNVGDTALIIACQDHALQNFKNNGLFGIYEYNLKIIRKLIKANANVNIKNKNGNTALITACSPGGNNHSIIKIVELLIESKSDVSIVNNRGNNALIASCEKYGFIDSPIKLLIDANSNVNTLNKKKDTALTVFCKQYYSEGKSDVIKYLIQNGAKIDLMGDNRALKLMESFTDIIQLLIEESIKQDNYIFINYLHHKNYVPLMNIKNNASTSYSYYKIVPIIHQYITKKIIDCIDDSATIISQSFKNLGDINVIQIIIGYIV